MSQNAHGQEFVAQSAAVRICTRCQKPMRPKRKGSLTGWILGSNDCACSQSTIKKNRVRLTQSGQVSQPPHTALPSLGSKYEIISLVGHGGMGNVYKVRDRMTGNILAVKTLRAELATDEKSIKRFKREAMTASRLSHPNVVAVYGYSETPCGSLFLVMDYVDGLSLEQHIRLGKIDWQEAIDLFVQICDALAYAHKHGVVHRDLKPGNIVVSEAEDGTDHVNILDLGISKLFSSSGIEESKLTQTGDIIGSPLYMSPEQCQGESVDIRTDIYSLGCVMFEMLTGDPPFLAENSVKVILKHINASRADLIPILQNNGVPKRLQEIIVRGCLSQTASDRFDSIELLREKLLVMRDQSRTIMAVPLGEKELKLKRAALSAVILIALAGALVAGLLALGSYLRPMVMERFITQSSESKQATVNPGSAPPGASADELKILENHDAVGQSSQASALVNVSASHMQSETKPQADPAIPVSDRQQAVRAESSVFAKPEVSGEPVRNLVAPAPVAEMTIKSEQAATRMSSPSAAELEKGEAPAEAIPVKPKQPPVKPAPKPTKRKNTQPPVRAVSASPAVTPGKAPSAVSSQNRWSSFEKKYKGAP